VKALAVGLCRCFSISPCAAAASQWTWFAPSHSLSFRRTSSTPSAITSSSTAGGLPQSRHGRLRMVHRRRARLHGSRPRRLPTLVRPQAPHGTSQDAHRHPIFRASSASSFSDFPRRMQFTARKRSLRARHSFNRSARACALATHQIALNTVAFTYMVPLGISSAAAVPRRSGYRTQGRTRCRSRWQHFNSSRRSFMTIAGIALIVFPDWIARVYTPDIVVIRATGMLLVREPLFQLFDGIQTAATGAPRRRRHAHTDALPLHRLLDHRSTLGYWLCFSRGMGALGCGRAQSCADSDRNCFAIRLAVVWCADSDAQFEKWSGKKLYIL